VSALLAVSACPSSAAAIPSADAIARINSMRTANGIPGDVLEDPALSAGCQAHAHYAALNGGFDTFAHHEVETQPGYTPAGADAAEHSVLASTGWLDPNPWISAPYHLQQILDPALTRTGYGEEHGFVCLQTLAALGRPIARQSIFTYPGSGTTGVPLSETAREADSASRLHVPGDAVGLPAGTTTGPYIMVYGRGFVSRVGHAQIQAASLTGPRGPVDVALTEDGFVIPRQPLAPQTTYTAAVTVRFFGDACTPIGSPSWSAALSPCPPEIPTFCFADPSAAAAFGDRVCDPGELPLPPTVSFPDQSVDHQWTFTTGAAAAGGQPVRPTVRLASLTAVRRGMWIVVTGRVRPPVAGAKVTVSGGGRVGRARVSQSGSFSLRLRVHHRRVSRVVVTVEPSGASRPVRGTVRVRAGRGR
jgi:hypothetical protein